MRLLAMGRGKLGWLPLGGGWTRHRDFPAPEGATFMAQWAARQADAKAKGGRS